MLDDFFDDFSKLKEVYCSLSISCRDCPYCGDPGCKVHDSDYYEPDDYDGEDIGSATVKEMRLQNGDF